MSMVAGYVQLSPEQLDLVIEQPEKAIDLAYPEDDSGQERAVLNIDKSWHLIHFLLTGDVWGGEPPLANVVLGGTELSGTDAGYGPFRYLTHEQVCETSQALSRVSAAELWGRFDRDRVRAAEIYPTLWAGDDGDRQYVTQNYESLRQFFGQAASDGKSLLLHLS